MSFNFPKLGYIDWVCPKCAAVMHDDIDEELGPFWSCVCDKCAACYDQDNVDGLTFTPTDSPEGHAEHIRRGGE